MRRIFVYNNRIVKEYLFALNMRDSMFLPVFLNISLVPFKIFEGSQYSRPIFHIRILSTYTNEFILSILCDPVMFIYGSNQHGTMKLEIGGLQEEMLRAT